MDNGLSDTASEKLCNTSLGNTVSKLDKYILVPTSDVVMCPLLESVMPNILMWVAPCLWAILAMKVISSILP